MEDYKPVVWASEPLSVDKLQAMLQNDQSVADEIDLKPRGILGYSELTMYASNTENKGYRNVSSSPLSGSDAMTNMINTKTKLKEYTRVYDNWQVNPNGLSVAVNVEPLRLIHIEIYIPLFVHKANSAGTASTDNWPIDAFIICRDGEPIVAESGTDIWTSQPGTQSLHSFYYDCFDYQVPAGPHVYEVMWRSQTASNDASDPLTMEIWEQNRTTFTALPSATAEPDQQYYVSADGTSIASASGRYNLSDFTASSDNPIKYVDGSAYYTGSPNIAVGTFTGSSTYPFAAVVPTAQIVVTDCGSTNSIIYYKEDDQIIGENINADPTA